MDRILARETVRLAGEWHNKRADTGKRLGGADATHLAAAVRLGCDYLMTTDGGFPIGMRSRASGSKGQRSSGQSTYSTGWVPDALPGAGGKCVAARLQA